jgi:hypothetical protein
MKNYTVAVCVDDGQGLMLFGKRQSRDRVLISEFVESNSDKKIYIAPFSKLLFEQYPDVSVADDPFSVAEEGSAIFVENLRIDERLDSVSTLIIYRWNRKYPSDVKFNVDPVKCGFKLKSSVDFKGSSHEKITKEIYEK